MTSSTNRYIREILHHTETPPEIEARFFYTSPLAIDDPLSPLPPLTSGHAVATHKPPRPFSGYDNTALDKAWRELRSKILRYNEERGEKSRVGNTADIGGQDGVQDGKGKQISVPRGEALDSIRRVRGKSVDAVGRRLGDSTGVGGEPSSLDERRQAKRDFTGNTQRSLDLLDPSMLPPDPAANSTTGTPFIRAPSRRDISSGGRSRGNSSAARPEPHALDSYEWDDTAPYQDNVQRPPPAARPIPKGPSAKVPVGVSRLHNVVMPEMNMEPIYWPPINDISPVIRGTWFYKDTMLPIETPVANMLEAGYTELQAWTETWQDELTSAVNVGAVGEERIVRMLWPDPKRQSVDSRPGTARGELTGLVTARCVLARSHRCVANSGQSPRSIGR